MAKGPKGSNMLILALIKTTYILLLIRLVRKRLKMDDLGSGRATLASKLNVLLVALDAEEGEEELKGVSSSKSASIFSSTTDTELIYYRKQLNEHWTHTSQARQKPTTTINIPKKMNEWIYI